MTAQAFERILYDGQKLGMATTPLDAYFAQSGVKPDLDTGNSMLWRGYVGTWEVRDNRLWLTHLAGHRADGSEATLQTVFPEATGPMFADWYTGTLKLARGKLLNYVHMGFASTYEEDILLTVDKGVVTSSEVHKNKPPSRGILPGLGRLFGR